MTLHYDALVGMAAAMCSIVTGFIAVAVSIERFGWRFPHMFLLSLSLVLFGASGILGIVESKVAWWLLIIGFLYLLVLLLLGAREMPRLGEQEEASRRQVPPEHSGSGRASGARPP